jgi:hypothetical protein
VAMAMLVGVAQLSVLLLFFYVQLLVVNITSNIIYINSLGLSVCDKAWEWGFVFPRAQCYKQDGGNGF